MAEARPAQGQQGLCHPLMTVTHSRLPLPQGHPGLSEFLNVLQPEALGGSKSKGLSHGGP